MVLALVALAAVSYCGPGLQLRGLVRHAPRSALRTIVAGEGPPPKGFGKDPAVEARLAKQLERLRTPQENQRRAEDAEYARMEQYVKEEGLDVMPEAIGERMLKRMLVFFGIPLGLGVLSFVAFIVAARFYDMTIRPTTVALTTQAIFALSVVGITYGPLSASWDEEREGSALGFEEVGKNLESLVSSLRAPTDGPPRS
jgi:hypothetical protein